MVQAPCEHRNELSIFIKIQEFPLQPCSV